MKYDILLPSEEVAEYRSYHNMMRSAVQVLLTRYDRIYTEITKVNNRFSLFEFESLTTKHISCAEFCVSGEIVDTIDFPVEWLWCPNLEDEMRKHVRTYWKSEQEEDEDDLARAMSILVDEDDSRSF